MKHLLIAFTLLISLPIFAQTGSKNYIDQNYIEVTGKAELEVVPDRIYLKILVNEKDNKNLTITDVERKMTNKLQEIGINTSKDLLMKDISSSYKSYRLAKSDILIAKEFQLIVRDSKTVNRIYIELEKIGISNITLEKLENSKIEEYRREVKINAIKAAKEKAASLAQAIDQKIGRAIYIKELENRYGFAPGASNTIMIRGAASINNNTNISSVDIDFEFEKIKIEYSILCKFELN